MYQLTENFDKSRWDIHAIRFGVAFIFFLFGTYKWFPFEARALETIWTTTWLKFIYDWFGLSGATYFLGIVENVAVLFLTLGFFKPKFGLVGDVLTIITGLTTLSLLPQLYISLGKIDSFIVKDILFVCCGIALLRYDFFASRFIRKVPV
ncbi:DUF417 family protein [Burkholderia pyrrocinia]|uniref:DUF417 family protein n=1 Tax=Burkholderia pyrrocinia TaxID=60550 RepID=UPI0010527BDC|nr:DUF417 family protein [Burkholderia pyrrocinia]TDA48902.1 DUF417 family protein [Burkholderia pyrrocinia]